MEKNSIFSNDGGIDAILQPKQNNRENGHSFSQMSLHPIMSLSMMEYKKDIEERKGTIAKIQTRIHLIAQIL